MYFTSSHTIIPCFPHNRMQARTLIRLLGYKPAPMIFKLTHFNSLWAWESKKKKQKKEKKSETKMREKVGQREDMDASEGASTRLCVSICRDLMTHPVSGLYHLWPGTCRITMSCLSVWNRVKFVYGHKMAISDVKKKSRINKESEHQTCKTQLLKATAHHLQILPRENEKCTNIMIPVNSYRKEIRS